MVKSVNLPPAYELIVLDGASAIDEAVRFAAAGEQEGTLVWSNPQVPEDVTGLDCALILRPNVSLETAAQLIYVAAVSLGAALAEAVLSLVELRFRWPNEIRVGLENTAFVDLRWPVSETGNVAWLVLGVRLEGKLGAIADDSTFPHRRPTAAALLERFARHFLADISRWDEDGFEIARRRWLGRADGIGESFRLPIGADTIEGIFETVDAQGYSVIRASDGSIRRLSAADFLCATS